MRIRWQDRITNPEVLDRADTTSIDAKILQAQLRWSGHVIRMEESRIPRQVFYSELGSGYRKKGRPKKRYKDNLKSNLKWTSLLPRQLEAAASNRTCWRALTSNAVQSFEGDRRSRLTAARDRRHRAASASVPTTGVPCPICNRICASDFVVTDGCKKMIWERVHLNKTLVNHDIRSVTAESETQCRIKCWFTDGCLSYSYGPISGGPKICNLSNSDHKMHPRDLVDKPDFRYRSAENSCNCTEEYICRVNFENNTHRCECPKESSSGTCANPARVKPCGSSPCKNNSTCTNKDENSGYDCTCSTGFTGSDCETQVKPCDSIPCKNNATCINKDDNSGYNCTCSAGFTRSDCETQGNKI
ncbi:neurogenic locus notch homolog protein 2 [Nematostella vectensis]|uniref:neurogenic locus notch homolog protein 2 n=1 Tax=Nematostella vectensis TaxID=45351 RepID=UPI0020778AC6|nr:neurogenic locus notch homolog protein 2 [Nematostella vectensis]